MTPLLSPYARLLGIAAMPDGGIARLVMPFAPGTVGRPGMMHGGAIAGLLEAAAIDAMTQRLSATSDVASRMKPVNFTVDFLRGVGSVTLSARGEVVRLGRKLATVEASAWVDDPTRPVARASGHFILRAAAR